MDCLALLVQARTPRNNGTSFSSFSFSSFSSYPFPSLIPIRVRVDTSILGLPVASRGRPPCSRSTAAPDRFLSLATYMLSLWCDKPRASCNGQRHLTLTTPTTPWPSTNRLLSSSPLPVRVHIIVPVQVPTSPSITIRQSVEANTDTNGDKSIL